MQFPPPKKGEEPSLSKEGYRTAQPGAKFVLPPPAKPDSFDTDAAVLEVAETIAKWGQTADWAATQGQNLGTVVQDYGNTIEELGKNRVMPWAVPTVAALSQAINRRADPTFPLGFFMAPLMRGRSDVENHNHTHITTTQAFAPQRGMNTKGRIYYAFVTPAVTRAYTQLNFMVSEVTSPCRLDIAVYVVDPNRGMTRQVHKTDAAASLGFGESVLTVDFPTFVADQGSYLAIAFLQHGTGNSRYILGLDHAPHPLLGSIFPPKISATNQQTGQTGLPSYIDGSDGAQVDFAGYWFTPYAELSEDVGVDYKQFVDRWAWTGPMGRPWVALAGSGVYASDGSIGASGFGYRVSLYETPLSTDFVQVRTSVARTFDNNFRRSTVVVRGSNDLRSGVGLSAINPGSNNGRYELIEWTNRDTSSNWDNRTVVRTIARVPQEGDRIEVDYLDGLVTVRINDAVAIDSQSVGGPVGSAGRFVGFQTERTGNVFVAYPSPRFGAWSARDVPQDDGGDDGEGEGSDGAGGGG